MSDYPMLISNKLHSFRNFTLQIYEKSPEKAGKKSRIMRGRAGWSIRNDEGFGDFFEGRADIGRQSRRESLFQDPFQGRGVQQIHRFESSLVEDAPVIEYAGQLLGLAERIHLDEIRRDTVRFAVLSYHFQIAGDKGALHIVIDGQRLTFDTLFFRIVRELRSGSVERKRQQLVAVVGRIDDLEAELPGKRLVRKPRFLLFRTEHADARFSMRPRIGQTMFHQRLCIALAFVRTRNPQTIDIIIVVANHGHPCRFERRVFDKDHALRIQLPEDVPLAEPVGKPPPLRLYARMGLLRADNAAQMLVGKVFGRQIDEFSIHGRLFNGMSGRHALR